MRSFHSSSARERVIVTAALGAVVGAVLMLFASWQLAVLFGWDVASGAQVGWVWITVGRWDSRETEAFATREDNSQTSARLILLGASVASLVGVGFALAKTRDLATAGNTLLTAVGLVTVVLSWAVVHTVYALHYARQYYTPPIGGIDFKSDDAPAYADFAYVAFTVGMTFQVSDTDIQDRLVRRTVLGHALLAYLFGAVILAVTVNVIANLLQ